MQWNLLIPMVCERTAQEFLRYLRSAAGPSAYKNTKHEWNPPAFNLLDRGAEAKADATELAIGKSTWPQLVSRNGNDPQKQLAEIQEYADELKAAGVDFFNGQILISEGNQQNNATP